MWVTTSRRIRLAPTCDTAARIACTDSSEFMPQSSRSTSSPSANRNTLTRPSSKGMGSRSSNTPVATSLSAISTTVPALSKLHVSAAAFAQEERMSEVQLSPDEIVEALPKYIIPEKAGSTKATIVFELSGANAGKWWVKIHDGAAGDAEPDPSGRLRRLGEDHDRHDGRDLRLHAGQAEDQGRHGSGDQDAD